jgi:hypothetical protein
MKNVNSPASICRVFTVQAIFYPKLRSCKKSDGSEQKRRKWRKPGLALYDGRIFTA